ncbi:MAG: [protein-PII] uridylyltransferase [Rhodocyclaceae bacterium]|nr:[protein-PII] uridylyltransferase [Rhodocyclaceae bacterium]
MVEARNELLSRHRQRLESGRAQLAHDYQHRPLPKRYLRGLAQLVDEVLVSLWHSLEPNPSASLLAVGGYGRGELFPSSDVDLLILTPTTAAAQACEDKLSALIGLCWDCGLAIGHSVRTIDACLEESQRDITVATALLEARYLAGSRTLAQAFFGAYQASLDPFAFFTAKRLEQEGRHSRYNDSAFNLEPNCKEAPGGLRDLHVLRWIARAAGWGNGWSALARRGIVSRQEARELRHCEDFLARLRIALHLVAQRREDRLLFDYQETIARFLGIEASLHQRAAERLMRRYYRNAKRITQLNTLLMLDFAARLEAAPSHEPVPLDEDFQIERDLLDLRTPDLFQQRPSAILKSFSLLSAHPELKGMTPRTLRALWHARHLIDANFRRDPANQRNFLALFSAPRGLTHQLRRMNQFDLLGAYLPAFARIVGQLQHDLFHIYTVDQHILQVVRNLRRLALPEFAHEFPFCSRLMAAQPKPWRIYLAALFHDIAKGRGGDHSQLGARDVRRFCRLHAIEKEDAEFIAFLVAHHLTMSRVAQHEDLGDPAVIRRFARLVETNERLSALYLLTVCDIRGTSPKVWNAWKAKLLEDLYRVTARVLAGEDVEKLAGIEARQEEARRLLRLKGLRPGVEAAFWRQLDTGYFMRHDSEKIAWHTQTLYHRPAPERPVVRARLNPAGAGLQVMIYTHDQPELFARLCGFFARLGYTIVDAKIHTTKHGYALDSFSLLEAEPMAPYRDMIGFIEHELAAELIQQPPLSPPPARRLSRQARCQPFTPEVSFRPDESGRYYILSLGAIDRAGLLYDVARLLSRFGVEVHAAKISTLGERVEDTFLASGAALADPPTLLRLEQELIEILRI